LTKESSWTTLRHIIRNCNVVAVHIAPPCGTCSRAREIKLSNQWHGPQPLRDAFHTYGVPSMSARDRLRVELANALYMHMCDFCFFSIQCRCRGPLRTLQTAGCGSSHACNNLSVPRILQLSIHVHTVEPGTSQPVS
jgi:hypothetical protein